MGDDISTGDFDYAFTTGYAPDGSQEEKDSAITGTITGTTPGANDLTLTEATGDEMCTEKWLLDENAI